MGQGRADGGDGANGRGWGCIGGLALGLLLLILDWELLGRLVLFLLFALLLAGALRDRSFRWVFDDRRLDRDAHPLGYWSLAAANGAFALLALWLLVEEVRQNGG